MTATWKLTAKRQTAGGLMLPAAVAALLMAAALIGCNTGSVVPRERVTGVPEYAEAAGQDNGSLTSSVPTAGEYERLERYPAKNAEPADPAPRVELRAPVLER